FCSVIFLKLFLLVDVSIISSKVTGEGSVVKIFNFPKKKQEIFNGCRSDNFLKNILHVDNFFVLLFKEVGI
ncbi:MAG TPA: hypothetical protein PKA31_02465, partial [Candidatus Moranbacteria bacterium]|nr:hypothetical protein [Candidatus Moranbacteria bacterium]